MSKRPTDWPTGSLTGSLSSARGSRESTRVGQKIQSMGKFPRAGQTMTLDRTTATTTTTLAFTRAN